MIDWNSVRLPIVIFSTARSGSSALANHIHRKVDNVLLFEEPEHDKESISNFLKTVNETNRYIVKIHSDGFEKYPSDLVEYFIHSPDPYKVCIRRRNQLEQCISLYISLGRQQWSYKKDSEFTEDTITINEQRIRGAIFWIKRQYLALDRINANFDLTVWYEDFEFDVTDTIKTPRPNNYDELCASIAKVYNELNV